MKFKTIKEMESELSKVTDIKKLHNDITFMNRGVSYTLRYISTGSANGTSEIYYMGDESAANVRITFSGSDSGITVNNVIVNVNA